MACLGTSTLLAFAGAERDPAEVARIEAHLDACEECRVLVAELADLPIWARPRSRGATTGGGSDARSGDALDEAAAPILPPGRTLDRYLVIDVVGAGGMGVVYAAFDPRLDRKVALKLLRGGAAASEERGARLLAEARTLARLRHPNVVAVHDAGRVDEQVFVAMEFVDGVTLRRWLEEPRSWREVLAVFFDAAAGLGAAHAAGVVHRDFKPENVLIDRDGAARVVDFGLARSLDGAGADAHASPSVADAADGATPIAAAARTRTGAVLGTPAYMAPEQRAGASDERSDQYSFCLALREALTGARDAAGAASAIPPPPGRRPARGRVPASVRRAIERGLEPDPADRHPSMAALVAALRRRPARRRALAAAATVAAVVAAAAIARPGQAAGPAAAAIRCDGAPGRVADVWGPRAREALRVRFLAAGRPEAAATFAAVAGRLDDHAARWSALHREVCVATHERGEQSAALLDERMACLDARLRELATRVTALGEIDGATLADAAPVVDGLIAVESCSSRSALAGRSAPTPVGRVSDFDDGTPAVGFGAGWAPSTDALLGGSSTASLTVVDDALRVEGEVVASTSPITWAGAMFWPGAGPMKPADLSAAREVAFRARGDGGTYRVLLFSSSRGDFPAFQDFPAGPGWTEHRFPLAAFDGINRADLTGLMFAAATVGPFSFQIDDVRFE